MKKVLQAIVMILAVSLMPLPVSAAGNNDVQNVLDDSLYGAGLGALVGLGAALVSSQPSNNWNYITRGAGVGIILGAGYGLFRTSKSFAEVEDGVIRLGMPSPEFAFANTAQGLDLVMKTDLIRGSF